MWAIGVEGTEPGLFAESVGVAEAACSAFVVVGAVPTWLSATTRGVAAPVITAVATGVVTIAVAVVPILALFTEVEMAASEGCGKKDDGGD